MARLFETRKQIKKKNAFDDSYQYDIFISYSHKDKRWVQKELLTTLERHGLRVCVDYRDFIVGKPSLINMQEASVTSRHTLLVVARGWIQSEWTFYEGILSRTADPAGLKRRTIPILLKKCTLPDLISMLTWVDFTNKRTQTES